jgi:hypothetical protein
MRRLFPYALVLPLLILLFITSIWVSGATATQRGLSQGQTVYVPVYSHVFFGDQARTFKLSVTLSIRNINVKGPIQITKVAYYDENGKHVRDFAEKPVQLKPWTSTRFFIKESDATGGAEAFFIVFWQAASKVNPPIIEGVMIGARGQQGVSFLTQGTPIVDKK